MCLCAIIPIHAWSTDDVEKEERVTILIIALDHKKEPVPVTIRRREDNGSWEKVSGEDRGTGRTAISEESCSSKVQYKVSAKRSRYFQHNDAPKFCSAPEVLFDQFVDTKDFGVFTSARYAEKSIWSAAFSEDGDAEQVAKELADSIAQGDYGRTAIIHSELASQFRKAGKQDSAKVFEALSYGATLEGITTTSASDVGQNSALITIDPFIKRPVLTEAGADIIATYQLEKDPSRDAADLGKADWTTMKSLAGGKEARTYRYELPTDALVNFDAGAIFR